MDREELRKRKIYTYGKDKEMIKDLLIEMEEEDLREERLYTDDVWRDK